MELNNSGFWDGAYRDNAPALLGVLRRYVKDMGVVQDLLHEVFITAIGKYDSYSNKGSFEGWLYRIAVNTALMHLRNERNTIVGTCHTLSLHELTDDDANDTSYGGERETIEAAGFSSEELLSAIDRLPEHHKLVFNMYVMDDFSHKQIAAELNISTGTSKSHLARARKKIQKILYDDAMNRKKKKERRRASAFLLLFPAKEHYIDKLFRDGLSDFNISPIGGAEFISAALEQQAASMASAAAPSVASVVTQTTAFWGGKLSYMAACCGAASITGTVCWLSMSVNSPLNRDNDRLNTEIIVNDTVNHSLVPVVQDTFIPDTAVFSGIEEILQITDDFTTNQEPSNENIPADEKTTEPVVVRKQIIQRQTVVVRDTIIIIE